MFHVLGYLDSCLEIQEESEFLLENALEFLESYKINKLSYGL